jgi:hypothetical protein
LLPVALISEPAANYSSILVGQPSLTNCSLVLYLCAHWFKIKGGGYLSFF